jgi:hypothetical protein
MQSQFQFDTNYIIFRNVEIFKKNKIQHFYNFKKKNPEEKLKKNLMEYNNQISHMLVPLEILLLPLGSVS